MSILHIQALNAGYGAKTVLHNINLTVTAGQFVSVVAPNGAGKSTLLKTVASLLPAQSGTIRLHDQMLTSYSRRALAQQLAIVGADVTAPDYTALQLVLLGRFPHIRRFCSPSPQDHAIVQHAMEDVGIWDKRANRYNALSQGERQKVIIARALAQQPQLLLLDEPTAHLDVGNQYRLLQLIKQLALHKNLAVIAVTHDINLALEFSTHLLILKDGRILAYGPPQAVATAENLQQLYGMNFTLYRDAATPYVRPTLSDIAD